jgi:hypothetical protein
MPPWGQFTIHPPRINPREFQSDPHTWSQRIREEVGRQYNHPGPETVIVYGAVSAGTPFEIVQVFRWTNGEAGTYWLAIGAMRDGEFTGRRWVLQRP